MGVQEIFLKVLNSKWFILFWIIVFGLVLPSTWKGMTIAWKPLAIAIFAMNVLGIMLFIYKFASRISEKKQPQKQEWD